MVVSGEFLRHAGTIVPQAFSKPAQDHDLKRVFTNTRDVRCDMTDERRGGMTNREGLNRHICSGTLWPADALPLILLPGTGCAVILVHSCRMRMKGFKYRVRLVRR